LDKKSVKKAIRNAIKLGDTHEVKRLIGNEKEILNTMTSFGTWLHVAAKKGPLEIVKYLIEKGIDIDARGGIFDASALNVAAGAGQLEIVKYLIEVGAELDVSLAKRNPLFGAIYGGHKEVAEFLVERKGYLLFNHLDLTNSFSSNKLHKLFLVSSKHTNQKSFCHFEQSSS